MHPLTPLQGTTVLKFAFVSPRSEDLIAKLERVKHPEPGSEPEVIAGKPTKEPPFVLCFGMVL